MLARDLCYKQVPCGVQNTPSPAIGRQTHLYAPRQSLLPAAIYTPSPIACLSPVQPQCYPFPVRSRSVRSSIPDLDSRGAYWVNSLKPIRYRLIGRDHERHAASFSTPSSMMQVRKNLWVRSGVIYLCCLHLPPTVALLEHDGGLNPEANTA